MKLKHIFVLIAAAFTISACNFLSVPPTGVIDDTQANGSPEKMVNAAYAALGADWYTYPFNLWPYGDVASDDCFKGGGGVDDIQEYHRMEITSAVISNMGPLDELWYRLYVAISRCNRALISIEDSKDPEFLKVAEQRRGEVLFLRAHFYYKLIQLFYRVPWIDEKVVRETSHESIRNDVYTHDQLMEFIIADFKEAYKVLGEAEPSETGRATKAAAAAYIAKCYLQRAYGDGYELTTGYDRVNTDYMDSVKTYTEAVEAAGYDLEADYANLFLPQTKNGIESVFAVQHSNRADDNTKYGRANWSNMLNGCHLMWSYGHDFHKPSQNLVNAFKTKNGLPMFDEYENEHNKYPVAGAPDAQKWDPRLFHTVGMPGFPYKYEGGESMMTMENSRTPNTYGYYTSLKEVPQRSFGQDGESPWQAFPMNDYVFRYADVLLWRAEALIELNDLSGAKDIINQIRLRAKASMAKIGYASDYCEISTYDGFIDQDDARRALRWERRLELAMEHERYFDLRRWGMLSETLTEYYRVEQQDMYEDQAYAGYLKEARFDKEKNEYWPVPYNQLYYVPGLYSQNKGYN